MKPNAAEIVKFCLTGRKQLAQSITTMSKARYIATALIAAGCATVIDEHTAPPADWPQLERRVEYVGFIDLQKRCYQYVSLGTKLLGGFAMQCVVIDFAAGTCTKYRPVDETDGDGHEAEHCAGRDHIGDSTLRDAWRNYQAYLAGQAIAGIK